MLLGGITQMVEHATGLDAGEPVDRVDGNDAVQIFRIIDQHRDVAALPGEAGTAAARDDRRAEAAAELEGRDDVVNAARHHNADRHLPVVRGVGGIERAAAVIEAHLAFQFLRQSVAERAERPEVGHRLGMDDAAVRRAGNVDRAAALPGGLL